MARSEFYGRGCGVCGGVITGAMSAHHIDADQKDPGAMRSLKEERVRDELEKCIPLCHNHHFQVHAALSNGCATWPLEDIIAKLKREHRAWVLEQAAELTKETL